MAHRHRGFEPPNKKVPNPPVSNSELRLQLQASYHLSYVVYFQFGIRLSIQKVCL